uniref:Uncharacterized protein n=1 Tax=viral metagenome TaxID=1070528 RepID=A0A6M3KQD9_9ZZZZ
MIGLVLFLLVCISLISIDRYLKNFYTKCYKMHFTRDIISCRGHLVINPGNFSSYISICGRPIYNSHITKYGPGDLVPEKTTCFHCLNTSTKTGLIK